MARIDIVWIYLGEDRAEICGRRMSGVDIRKLAMLALRNHFHLDVGRMRKKVLDGEVIHIHGATVVGKSHQH